MLFSSYCREFNSLQKKIYRTFSQDQYFFQKIKSYSRWLAAKFTVKFYLAPEMRHRKFYLAPGMRNEKIYLAPNDSYEKFYLAVKGLTSAVNCCRVLGLTRFSQFDCAEPWLIRLRPQLSWVVFANVAVLVVFYFILALETRRFYAKVP